MWPKKLPVFFYYCGHDGPDVGSSPSKPGETMKEEAQRVLRQAQLKIAKAERRLALARAELVRAKRNEVALQKSLALRMR